MAETAPAIRTCPVCDRPLVLEATVAVVRGHRYHAWCYLTVCAPGAPRGHGR